MKETFINLNKNRWLRKIVLLNRYFLCPGNVCAWQITDFLESLLALIKFSSKIKNRLQRDLKS